LEGTRLSRGTRLVERLALPELAPGTAVGVVPSVIELFAMLAPVVVEPVVADKADDGAGDGVATNNGRERDDCPEIGYPMDGELPEGRAVGPPLLGPTDPSVGLTDAIGNAEGVADPVGTANDALAVDAVALPGEVPEGKAVDPPLFGPTDPSVGLTGAIGDAEGVADPIGTAKGALEADAVALPGEVPEGKAVDPPLVGPTDPNVGLTGAIGSAEGVADPVGTAKGALAVDAVAVPGEVPEGRAVDPPLLGPTDPGVGLTGAIGDAEGVADPVGTAKDALAVDAVALPGLDAVALPVIGVALAEIGAVAAAFDGGTMTWAPVAAGVVRPALAPPWPIALPTAGARVDGLVRTGPEVAGSRRVAERLRGERIPSEPSFDWRTVCSATPFGAVCKAAACEETSVPSAV
jgi:hypothetical protein